MPFYRVDGMVVHLKLSGKAAKNPPPQCCARIGREAPTTVTQRCGAISAFACDWPVEGIKDGTCNAPLCGEHAHEVSPDRHLCPQHRELQLRTQPELF